MSPKALDVARASYSHGPPTGMRQGVHALMRRIGEIYMEHPWMGAVRLPVG